MKKHIELTLDNISKIGSKIINPKHLVCSLCYCIHLDLKQCKNSKCLKLFCEICYVKSKMIEPKCPFCRESLDYRKPDNELYLIINSLFFFCNSLTCNSHYTYLDYFTYHSNHNKNKQIRCIVCSLDISNTLNKSYCIMCGQNGCTWILDSISINSENRNNLVKCCLKRCFLCHNTICIKCLGKTDRKYGNNFICEYCNANCFFCYEKKDATYVCDFCQKIICVKCIGNCETCDYVFCKDRKCYKEKMELCLLCSKIKTHYYTCLHINLFQCRQCYPFCNHCKERKGIINCNSCSKLLCGIYCGIKCKECKLINCASCMRMCSICKNVFCSSCSKECSNCTHNVSLITCKFCNSDTIRKCQYPQCLKNLCINCWNVCNYCNTIFCNAHSITCINCEDSMCNLHYHQCNLCTRQNKDEYKKLCLKKCTLKCSFCPNISNTYCNPSNHQITLVNNYNCDHNVCLSCIKKCDKCQKIVIQCPKCIVNYYFINCKYCNKYLCITCSKYCIKCEDNYCSFKHFCFCCSKEIDYSSCLNCLFAQRVRCRKCNTILPQCEICNKIYICSSGCYMNFINKIKENESNNHLCQSFECTSHYEENRNEFCLLKNNN